MDELIFLAALIAIVGAILFVGRSLLNKQTGRRRDHSAYHETHHRQPSHRPASHKLVHSHSTERVHASDEIWRNTRVKANETRWESGVVVANKILTDSELALEERDPEEGHGMPSIVYKPVKMSEGEGKSAAKKGGGR